MKKSKMNNSWVKSSKYEKQNFTFPAENEHNFLHETNEEMKDVVDNIYHFETVHCKVAEEILSKGI